MSASASASLTVIRVSTYLPEWLVSAIDGEIGSNGLTRSEVMRRGLEKVYAKKRPVTQ